MGRADAFFSPGLDWDYLLKARDRIVRERVALVHGPVVLEPLLCCVPWFSAWDGYRQTVAFLQHFLRVAESTPHEPFG